MMETKRGNGIASVFATRHLPEVIEARMGELFQVRLWSSEQPMNCDDLKAAVDRADVLVPTLGDRIDRSLIEAAGNLKLIANFGNGFDHIDVVAAHDNGIVVTNTPGVLTDDTADMTMALILAVPRRLKEGIDVMSRRAWRGWSPTWMLGRRISGKKLGIIGMGRIGTGVARRARAFGMEIHYHNRRQVASEIENELGATYWPSLDQMLARVDIVSIHCPHTPATFHLLSARRLALMKAGATVVNTARGEIIDENALIELIESGHIAGAALDVFEHEPQVDSRLFSSPHVVLLPHMSSATIESRIEMGERVIVNIRAFLDGHSPPHRVLPSMV